MSCIEELCETLLWKLVISWKGPCPLLEVLQLPRETIGPYLKKEKFVIFYFEFHLQQTMLATKPAYMQTFVPIGCWDTAGTTAEEKAAGGRQWIKKIKIRQFKYELTFNGLICNGNCLSQCSFLCALGIYGLTSSVLAFYNNELDLKNKNKSNKNIGTIISIRH